MSEYAKYVDSDTTPNYSGTYNKGYIYGLVLNITLGGFFFGYVMSAFNPIKDWVSVLAFGGPIPSILITLMTAFVPLGAGIGALTTGGIAKALGRKKTSLLVDTLSIIGTVLTLLPSSYLLLIGRLLQGWCVGANSSLVPLMINEVAPNEIAGSLGTFNQLQICFGVILAPVIALGMPTLQDAIIKQDTGNKFYLVILGFAGLAPLIRLLLTLFIFNYDTPKYLVSIDDDVGAHGILSKIYGDTRAQNELVNLKRQRDIEAQAGKLTLGDIFGPRYRRRLLVALGVAIFQQLSGINAIIFFSNSIFAGGKPDPTSNLPTVYTIVMDALQILGCLVAGLVIEKLGRKVLLIGGFAFSAVVLAGYAILAMVSENSPAGKFFIWGYILGFGLTLGPVPWIYISDILPDVAIGIAVLGNWTVAFILGLTFEGLVGGTSIQFAFFLLSGFCVVSTAFSFIFVKETKGKSNAEIAAEFTGKDDSTTYEPSTNYA